MDDRGSSKFSSERDRFRAFLDNHVKPYVSGWYQSGSVPRDLFETMGQEGWYGFVFENGLIKYRSPFWDTMVAEELARVSPGVAVTVLVQVDLGLMALYLCGSETLKKTYAKPAIQGNLLICLGNTEKDAGSDVAGISMNAERVDGGWVLNGTKAYVTNGVISDYAVITAVTDRNANRNQRLSMFFVDLNQDGVARRKLNKQVWIPSDLTRIQLKDVFVPEDHLMGTEGQGLQQVLSVFSHSRVPISAMTLGTAQGAFDLAVDHARNRSIFDEKIVDFQAKAFETADLYARMEAARLVMLKACTKMETGDDFRLEASMAKYLSVEIARDIAVWAADIFGAASVIFEHPIHKFPMDAWASSLGEGTQDVQKLVIFRELMKRM